MFSQIDRSFLRLGVFQNLYGSSFGICWAYVVVGLDKGDAFLSRDSVLVDLCN